MGVAEDMVLRTTVPTVSLQSTGGESPDAAGDHDDPRPRPAGLRGAPAPLGGTVHHPRQAHRPPGAPFNCSRARGIAKLLDHFKITKR
ncbi:hypothetical protein GCM10010488_08980 [Oerskovia jenensis]